MCQRAVIETSRRVRLVGARSGIVSMNRNGRRAAPPAVRLRPETECYWPSQGFHFASFSSTHFLAASSAVMSWFVM